MAAKLKTFSLTYLLVFYRVKCPKTRYLSNEFSSINQFNAIDLFLYPLKTSENLRLSDVFRGYRKKPVAWNRLIRVRPQLYWNIRHRKPLKFWILHHISLDRNFIFYFYLYQYLYRLKYALINVQYQIP